MSSLPVFVASDVHYGAAPPENEAAFLDWLQAAVGGASRVVLNGDLFDFWFEYRKGIPKGNETLLAVLRDVVDAGLPVTLMGGNHDWWGGSYLRDEIGLEFLQYPVVRTFAGFRTFLAHGDGLGAGDLKYKALRWCLRSPFVRWPFRELSPSVGDWMAGRVSRTEHRAKRLEPLETRDEALEEFARAKLAKEPDLDLVVFGHTHIPRLEEVAPRRWYANAGDWVYNRTYLVLDQGKPPRVLNWGA